MIPAKIKIRENKYLFILWDDNSESKIELKKLREFCPSISWKDGHNTGIYEYSFLKNLAVSK